MPEHRMEDRAKRAVEAAERLLDRMPKIADLLAILDNKETEIRLRFDKLTLDGDIALSITLVKGEEKA